MYLCQFSSFSKNAETTPWTHFEALLDKAEHDMAITPKEAEIAFSKDLAVLREKSVKKQTRP